MLKTRLLILLLLTSLPATRSSGQDLLNNLRQRVQNRALRGPCECGASTPLACACQDCGEGASSEFSYGYQAPSSFLPGSTPSTGDMVQPLLGSPVPATPGMQPNASYDQPNYSGATSDSSTQFANPGIADTMPPAANAGMFGAAGQDGGEGFGLSNQFAGQGEASGVRDLTIGDFFSGSGAIVGDTNGPTSIPIAGGDRRRKVSDHFSPIPVNRTFFSYHGFGDAARDINGNQTDVQRFTFGLERMFWNNNASFEVRLPFEHGVSSQQTEGLDPLSSATATEFGNITFATKYLLRRQRNYSISAGVASILPTASNAQMFFDSGALDIQNDSYDIIPFLAYNFKPNQNSWATLTTQLDFNVRGNEFISNRGTSFEQTGIYNDQNLYSIDLSTGRWLWNDSLAGNRLVRGMAAIFELHYTTTINDADLVDLGSTTITNPFNRTDTLNSTVGFRFQLGQQTYATFASVFPLRTGDDQPFETEFNFNLSRLY